MKQTSPATKMVDPLMAGIPSGGFIKAPLRGKDLPDELFTLRARPLFFAGETGEPSYRLFIIALFVMCMAVALVAILL